MSALAKPETAYAVQLASPVDFDGWRKAARALALAGVAPRDIVWRDRQDEANELFAPRPLPPAQASGDFSVPREFLDLARTIICHRDPGRFDLLYRMLCRLRLEPRLLGNPADADVARLLRMEKSIGRDIHKMHAFVRFRRIDDDGEERFAAWFEPDHYIVERAAPFFMRRFAGMVWSIFTPDASAHWDRSQLTFGPGASRDSVPAQDASEDLWRIYFASIFNPARLKVKAMQAEMPRKYWHNLPEASLIPDLIARAEQSARQMIDAEPTPSPERHRRAHEKIWTAMAARTPKTEPTNEIAALRTEAEGCSRCDLYRHATQTVFGEGPARAQVMFVGEQPGDREDIAGKPFVGPAGQLLDEVLEQAGVDRTGIYVTNAVKHFKFTPRGKRRIHQKPNAGEVQACRWWLDHEVAAVEPRLVVALGATAAQAVLGKPVAVTRERGRIIEREDGLRVFVTIHPSFLLRIPDAAEAQAERARFLKDMQKVAELIAA